MAKLTPKDEALRAQASADIDALLAKWHAMGVPPHGQTGMLLATYVRVSMQERGMGIELIVQDIIDCLEGLTREESN